MYSLANSSACTFLCSSRNHALRYSLIRRQQTAPRSSERSFSKCPATYKKGPWSPKSGGTSWSRDSESKSFESNENDKRNNSSRREEGPESPFRSFQWDGESMIGGIPLTMSGGFISPFKGNTDNSEPTDRREEKEYTNSMSEKIKAKVRDGNVNVAIDEAYQLDTWKTSGPSPLPKWLIQNNILLWEESAATPALREVKLITGDGTEVKLRADGQGVSQLIDRFKEEPADSEIVDDKVGPFPIIPQTPSEPEGASSPEAYLSVSHFLEVSLSIAASLAHPERAEKEIPSVSYSTIRTNLALYSPFDGSTFFLKEVMNSIAEDQNIDVIHLDSHDISELSGHFLSKDHDVSHESLLSLGFNAHKAFAESAKEDNDQTNSDEEEYSDEVENLGPRLGLKFLGKGPSESKSWLSLPGAQPKPDQNPLGIGIIGQIMSNRDTSAHEASFGYLSHCLGGLIDAASFKRKILSGGSTKNVEKLETKPEKLVICISDFLDISQTTAGQKFMDMLGKWVLHKRRDGQKTMIVGLSGSSEIASRGITNSQRDLDIESEETSYQTMIIPPFNDAKIVEDETAANEKIESNMEKSEKDEEDILEDDDTELVDEPEEAWVQAQAHEILQRNIRHLKDMVLHLCNLRSSENTNLQLRVGEDLVEDYGLDTEIFSQTDIHRLAKLIAGIHNITGSAVLSKDNLELALSIIEANQVESAIPDYSESEERTQSEFSAGQVIPVQIPKGVQDLKAIKSKCDQYEKRLLRCIISPQNIRTTFSQIHAPSETIDALRTLTSLSLLRPEAFSYGVLRSESIPGLLLYGPPGTGKTLLAKAVAKESGATMLAVSGSEVNNMYVGESEKSVRAIFSLARKLAPCVIFIDEADGILSARTSSTRRTGHRETLNQFLKEIEHFGGSDESMNAETVFLMVATNRPFDLDDAVLRRLPRRLLVDLPTEQDRGKILAIHLRDETLDPSISLTSLANRTAFYSGSDLKNLCVAAALACVREENVSAVSAKERGETAYKHPVKRTLHARHFETAIGEISASVSDDMGTLKQIRTFDEKYGDRKGRRKRVVLGFGQREVTDEMLRVRV